jgi:magnesium transporter
MLGTACGFTVGMIAWVWRGMAPAAATIGVSILLILCAASIYGLSIPSLLHRLRLDLKIAAGPVTLAITDISTLVIYLGLARKFL